jgi:predicted adenylyl cyclase CyaB
MIVVELKARLRDRAAALAAVSSFARSEGEVDKADEYWREPGAVGTRSARGFRIRTEGGASVVNFKTKRSEGGVEINRESEFDVSDRATFIEFLRRLGCESDYAKRKRGFAFRAGGDADCPDAATIEVLEVQGLGDFIEIEILLEREEPVALARAQRELRALLARAGVSESDIEGRFYSELLAQAGLLG